MIVLKRSKQSLQSLRYSFRREPLNYYKSSARFSSTSTRSWSTPLAKTIAGAIDTTGPISIAAYMRQCLTSPDGGYYTSQERDRDHIGQKGDFITSPEISQVFGELLGLWFVAQWIAQGRKQTGVELIEVGPGRGTLIDDMLRTMRNFKSFASNIESVYLIEASKNLREQQKLLLCGEDEVLEEIDIGWRSLSKYAKIPVTWCEDIRFVPNDKSKAPFIVAHEFFDALPIHAFQSVAPAFGGGSTIEGLHGTMKILNPTPTSHKPQWRELLVVPTQPSSTITTSTRPALNKPQQDCPDFQLTLAKASNPNSLIIPESSQRYKAIKHHPGSLVEISPESYTYAAEFGRRIGGSGASRSSTRSVRDQVPEDAEPGPSGAALIIDYGTSSTIPTSTLRGIRSHNLVSPFSRPGEVDLSADVDFTALAEAAIGASEGIEVHGPVEQREWLEMMGIRERIKILCAKVEKEEGGDETSKKIKASADRLVDKSAGGMGKLYKFLAIVPESGGRRPVGFGGSLDT